MQLADAQALTTALMGLGYGAWVSQVDVGDWQVQTRAPGAIDRPTVNAFAAQHNAGVRSYDVTTAVTFE